MEKAPQGPSALRGGALLFPLRKLAWERADSASCPLLLSIPDGQIRPLSASL